ncbi:MAG: N-6 DNA methylase [Planctomycetota bacterium]
MGAYYTPEAVCRFLAAWGVDRSDAKVLEPSCGDASFLVAAAERMDSLSPENLFDQNESRAELIGVEIDKETADSAANRLNRTVTTEHSILTGDFFDQHPSQIFDAVLGNPPFVRYHGFAGSARTNGLRAALAGGVNLNGLASSWAPFLVHACGFLKPQGKLGMVLPAELLTVHYASPIRTFLLKRFAKLKIILFERLLFEGAQEDVILLLAEGTGGCDHINVVQVSDANDLPPDGHIRVDAKHLESDKWTATLVNPNTWETFRNVAEGNASEPLGDWGEVYLGAVTGCNKFFCLSTAEADAAGLSEEDLIPISPPGSRHLRELVFGEPCWRGLCDDGKRGWLFYPDGELLSRAARAYIKSGEQQKVQDGYKCRHRNPWWRVPTVDVPDLFLTYMAHDRPRLVTNTARAHHLNSLYGIRLHHGRKQLGREVLPLASLNTVTLLGAEFHGRAYGGGMLKLEPRESECIPFPNLRRVQDCRDDLLAKRPQVANAVGRGDLAKAVAVVDSILWNEDYLSASAHGILKDARQMMFDRRIERGRSRD